MRFWSPFHTNSLDIISDCPRKLVFRAPNSIRLRMTVDHIQSDRDPGSCFTQYNHDTCLWECYHSPSTIGHHRLFIWLFDIENDKPWATAVRFDVYIDEKNKSLSYPVTTDIFNTHRCQLIRPMNVIISRKSLPADILIRAPNIRGMQLQADEQTIIQGRHLQNYLYRFRIPSIIPERVKNLVIMGLCFNDMFYSILITYRIE